MRSETVTLEPARGRRMPRAIRIGLVVLVLAGGAALALSMRPSTPEGPRFQTEAITRGDITKVVTATGKLEPSLTVQVGSQVSGRLLEVLVDFNSEVEKDQVIARIEPDLFEAQVRRAEANLRASGASMNRAEASFEVARQRHERTKILAEKHLISEADVESDLASFRAAQADLLSSRASYGQAESNLETAQLELSYTTIRSPIDGVVISRDVEVGQTVAASLQAPQLFAIAGDLRDMVVHTNVSEADVGELAPDMPVEFRVDAYADEAFPGRIKEIRYSPTTVQNVVTYDAVVSLRNEDLRLRPGMTATVSFQTESAQNVVRIPNAALRFRPQGVDMREAMAQAASAERGASEPSADAAARGEGGADAASEPSADTAARTEAGDAASEPRTRRRRGERRRRPAGEGPDFEARRQAWQARQARQAQQGGARPGPRAARRGTGSPPRLLWVLGAEGELRPVRVRLGITDDRFTELVRGDLDEGDVLVTAEIATDDESGSSNNRGGGRRRRGRFPF